MTGYTDPTLYAYSCICNSATSATLWSNFESNDNYQIHTCLHAPSPPPPPLPLLPPVPPAVPNVVCEGAGLAAGTWYEPTADSGKIAEYSATGKTLAECLQWCGSQAPQLCAVRGAVLSKWDIRCGAPFVIEPKQHTWMLLSLPDALVALRINFALTEPSRLTEYSSAMWASPAGFNL